MKPNYTRGFALFPLLLAFFSLSGYAQFDLLFQTEAVKCFGSANGRITTIPTGRWQPPLTFILNDRDTNRTGIFTGLRPGTYTIAARDAGGQTARRSIRIQLLHPPILIQSLAITPDTICTGNNGKIIITATGGRPPLRYRIGSRALQPSDTLMPVFGGYQTVQIQDSAGCTIDTTVLVDDPAVSILISVDARQPSCVGQADGQFIVQASGGEPPYAYALDSPTFESDSLFKGLAGQQAYTIFVRDQRGCINSLAFPLFDPPALRLARLTSTPSRCGQRNGTITALGTGGTGQLSYAINQGDFRGADSAFTAEGLAAARYWVRVKDANGCLFQDSITVQEQNSLEIRATIRHQSCPLAQNGQITVAGFGGVAPYQFSFNGLPFGTTTTFNGLVAGNYRLIVRDSVGCQSRISAQVVIFNDLRFQYSLKHPLCQNGNTNTDGCIRFAVQGGTPPYQYATDGFSFQSAEQVCGLNAGVYFLEVKDSNNCVTQDFVIAELLPRAALDLRFTIRPATCHDAPDGQITVQASGGTAPYRYRLQDGIAQTSPILTGVQGDTVVVVVEDASGCVDFDSVLTNNPQPITVASTLIATSCPNSQDGQITVQASGGTPPYRYALNNTQQAQTNPVFRSIGAQFYAIYVLDANNCLGSQFVTLDTTRFELETTAPTCKGIDGALNVKIIGGNYPYQFQLNDDPIQMTPVFEGLSRGFYRLTIRSTNCVFRDTFTLTGPEPLQVRLFPENITNCLQRNGRLTVRASLRAAQLEYSLDGKGYQRDSIFDNLIPGAYQVYIKDSIACFDTLAFAIDSFASRLAVRLQGVDLKCADDLSGRITVEPVAGIVPYLYRWSTGSVASTLEGLSAGSYSLTLTDGRFCQTSSQVTLSQPTPLEISTRVDSSRRSVPTGSIVAKGAGGTPPYRFALGNGPLVSGETFDKLAAGTYTVRVVDNNGCIDTSSVIVPMLVGQSEGLAAREQVFHCYPNPVRDKLMVVFEKPLTLQASLSLVNAMGQLVAMFAVPAFATSVPIELGHLPRGYYLLQLKQEAFQVHATILVVD
jgi:large repetitive protein